MTTITRQEAFLRRFHAERPGVTGEALVRGAGPDGRSSYAMLGDLVRGAGAVLDLGCGDGVLLELLAREAGAPAGRVLAGVDLSAEALAAARGRAGVPAGAALVQGRGQRLPFADGVFDACVSHLVLMLVDDVERVAAEVARVLAPGGVLACVVGGGAVPGGDDAYGRFQPLLRAAVEVLPAGRRVPRLGDPRTRTREGLDGLLRAAGFGPVVRETVPLRLDGTAEEVWGAVSGLYDLAPLSGPDTAALRAAFLAEVAPLAGPDGRVPCALRLHLVRTALAAG